MVIAPVPFYFNFIFFVPTGHANFDLFYFQYLFSLRMLFLALKKVEMVTTNKLQDYLKNYDITKLCFRTKHAE